MKDHGATGPLCEESDVTEAGQPFGSEWPPRYRGEILDGAGRIPCEAASLRAQDRPGDDYRLAAGGLSGCLIAPRPIRGLQ